MQSDRKTGLLRTKNTLAQPHALLNQRSGCSPLGCYPTRFTQVLFVLLSTNLVPLRTHDRSPGGMVRRTPWKDGTAKATCQYHRRRTFHRVPRGSHSPRRGQRRLPTTLWPSAPHHRMLTVTVLTSIRGDFSSCRLCKQSPPFE